MSEDTYTRAFSVSYIYFVPSIVCIARHCALTISHRSAIHLLCMELDNKRDDSKVHGIVIGELVEVSESGVF